MSLDAALGRLLKGSGCEALRPDNRTLVIRPARPRPGGHETDRTPQTPTPPRPAVAAAPTELSDVVVTAQKRETLLSSSASGLTAVSGAELARAGVADVSQLSLLAAGVTVTNLGPGRDKILLRGLSDGPLTGHAQSTVGIYLGEMRLTYNAPDPDFPFLDVARIEVLRGPQGSLYGAGSVGGVLHVVPNAPDPAGRSGSLEVTGSATAHGDSSSLGVLVANTPISDLAAARLVAWRESSGGYLDDQGRHLTDVDRTRRQGVRLSAAWLPTETLTLDATFVDQTIDTRDAHYAQALAGPLARATTAAEPHDNDFMALTFTAHWSPQWGRATATISALNHTVATTYAADQAPTSLTLPGARPLAFEDENEIRALVAEARLTATRGRLQGLFGGFATLGEQRLDGTLNTTLSGAGYIERRRDLIWEAAVFGEVSADLTDHMTLTAGGRLFDSQLTTASTVSLGGPLRRFDGKTHTRGFAPMVRVAWRLAPRLTLYGLAAEGYRAGGFNTAGPPGQVFAAAIGAPQPLRRYSGDELWSYETGARWRSQSGRIALRAAVFNAIWRDIQADLILPSGLPYTANLGDGRSRGVELEAAYRAGGLHLTANLVSQDPELVHLAPGFAGRADTRLPGMPAMTYAVSAQWSQPLGSHWVTDLAASYSSVGPARLTLDGSGSPPMGDYGDLRLSLALRDDRYSLGLAVENALDRKGDTLAFGNPFSYRSSAQHTPQRPRTIRLTARRAF